MRFPTIIITIPTNSNEKTNGGGGCCCQSECSPPSPSGALCVRVCVYHLLLTHKAHKQDTRTQILFISTCALRTSHLYVVPLEGPSTTSINRVRETAFSLVFWWCCTAILLPRLTTVTSTEKKPNSTSEQNPNKIQTSAKRERKE